jgi:hypothetical protein
MAPAVFKPTAAMAPAVTRERLAAIQGRNLAQAQAWGPAPEGETENALEDGERLPAKKPNKRTGVNIGQPLMVKTECAFRRFSAT